MGNNDKDTVKINSARPDGMVMQIVTSLLCIGIGAILILIPEINILYLCYCFCAALIVVGITLIVSYFISGAYKRLNDYRFATGVLLVILGCIELLRAELLAEEIMFIIGLVTLVLSVIIMQSVVQMRILESSAWIVQLIFTVASLAGAIIVLIDFKPVIGRVDGFAYYVMVITGTLCMISLLIEAIIIKVTEKREANKDKKEENKDDQKGSDDTKDNVGEEIVDGNADAADITDNEDKGKEAKNDPQAPGEVADKAEDI